MQKYKQKPNVTLVSLGEGHYFDSVVYIEASLLKEIAAFINLITLNHLQSVKSRG